MLNKICVVGAGRWGKNHIRTLYEMENLGGIVETDKSIRNYFFKKYPDIHIYDSIKNVLREKIFDGFIVATPSDTHYKIGKKIIQSKKHLLIEKPLTLNVENAKELVELACKNNVNLMVGHVLLFHPAINKIKEIIKSGKIGKLQYIYSNRLNLGKVRTQENAFWSLAPHDIAIFQYLTESFPSDIKANGVSILQKGIYDSTITQVKYPNGVKGHIFVSWLHPFKEHRLVVIGSEAMISFEDSLKQKPLKLYSKKIDIKDSLPEKVDGPVEEIDYKFTMPLKEELRYFTKHLDGSKLSLANGTHALEVQKILVLASEQLSKYD